MTGNVPEFGTETDLAQLNDSELMYRYQAGERRAFVLLVERYTPVLTRYLNRILQNREAVEDVMADTFLRVHEKCDLFKRDANGEDYFRAWILTIARNKAMEYFRKEGRLPTVSLDQFDSNGNRTEWQSLLATEDDPPPETDRRMVWVIRNIERISSARREAVMLRWRDGLSNAEVAHRLNISASAASLRAHRGVRDLRTIARREMSQHL